MKRLLLLILILTHGLVLFSQVPHEMTPAKQVPNWVREGIMYQLFLGSFTTEGTLRAAATRLDNVAELGITIVYLCPVMVMDTSANREFWSPRQKAANTNNPLNPYRIMDYTKIDPGYGTGEDFKLFVQTAQKLGMRVIMDLVYWHMGPSSILRGCPGFFKRDAKGKFVTNQYNWLLLNFEDEETREYLLKNMEYWMKEYDLDGFRTDVSCQVPLDFWEEARIRIEKIKPDVGMLAESNCPEEMLKAFDISYGGHTWYQALKEVFVNGKPATELVETWNRQNGRFPEGTLFIRFSDWLGSIRSNVVFSDRGSRCVSVINFMLDGVPFLYNGQEIGDGAPLGVFARHWPVLWESQGLTERTVLRNWYKKLIALKRNEPVLQNGKTIWLESGHPESVAAFLRRNGKEEILTVVNSSNHTVSHVKVMLPEQYSATYIPLFSDDNVHEFIAEKGVLSFSLNSFGYIVSKKLQN